MPERSPISQAVPPADPAVAKNRPCKDFDLQQCLRQYATAAVGVAGVSALAVAQTPAPHHIWYTAANVPLTENAVPTQIDFNHDGIPDITISVIGGTVAFSGHGGAVYGSVNETPAPGNLAIGSHALAAGVPIDFGGRFKSIEQKLAFADQYVVSGLSGTISSGPFKNVTNKYLGVKFQISGQTHEGWIRLTIICSKGSVSGTISGYAFNTVANQGIAAGQIRGPVPPRNVSIEEASSGSLGMLAQGAPAIPYWRK